MVNGLNLIPPYKGSSEPGARADQKSPLRGLSWLLDVQSEAVRRRAQPVARDLGKRWERRLPAGSWAQPTHGRFAPY